MTSLKHALLIWIDYIFDARNTQVCHFWIGHVCQAKPATTSAFLWVRLAWRSIRNFQTPIWTSWPRWQVVDAARTARGRWRASRWDFRRPTRPWCVRVLLVCDRCFHRIHINDFERIWARLPVASLLSVLLVVVALFLIRKNKFIFNVI